VERCTLTVPVSLYSPPLTLGSDICKPVPLTLTLIEVIPPYSLPLSVNHLNPQISSPLLLYSFACLRQPGGHVHRSRHLHKPRGLQRYHNANPYLEEDWDPKMSLERRWAAALHIPPLFSGLAISVLYMT